MVGVLLMVGVVSGVTDSWCGVSTDGWCGVRCY